MRYNELVRHVERLVYLQKIVSITFEFLSAKREIKKRCKHQKRVQKVDAGQKVIMSGGGFILC